MVPNISRNGRSFRGAGAYHLHDKPDAAAARPRTSERVAFTVTRNLATADPHAALDEMWRTAEDAGYLKVRSGVAPTGRKNDTPVKTVSLAWAPGQSPTGAEMCRAADSFMKAMGWTEYQALYVAHSDTRHPVPGRDRGGSLGTTTATVAAICNTATAQQHACVTREHRTGWTPVG